MGEMAHCMKDVKELVAGKSDRSDSERRRPSGFQQQPSRARVECYTCGRAGHLARDCAGRREQSSPRAPSGVRCYKCDKVGHMARDCKTRGVTCYHCGQEGHVIRDCPDYAQGNSNWPSRGPAGRPMMDKGQEVNGSRVTKDSVTQNSNQRSRLPQTSGNSR